MLYKYNIQYIKTLDLAFESSIDFGQWDDAKRFGMELVEGYRYVFALMALNVCCKLVFQDVLWRNTPVARVFVFESRENPGV